MPRHFKGLTGLAKEKALAEHRAITGEEMRPDLEIESPLRPDLGVDYAPGGKSDAMGRSAVNYAGDGTTGYNAIGAPKPINPYGGLKPTMYQEGGEVPEEEEKGAEIFGMSPSEQKELAKKVGKAIKKAGKTAGKKIAKEAQVVGKAVKKHGEKVALGASVTAGSAALSTLPVAAGVGVMAAGAGVVKDIIESKKVTVTDAELDAEIDKKPYLGDYPREKLREEMIEDKKKKKKKK